MNYFDHAASSIIYPEVLELMAKAQREDFANPGAQHILGHDLYEKMKVFRHDFLQTLNAHKNDAFIFTSSATESNNTVIRGLPLNENDIVVFCRADHPSVVAPVMNLCEQFNIQFREITLESDGRIDVEKLTLLLDEKVKLVVLTHVNNQSGVVNDIEMLSQIIKSKSSAHVHVDGVQSFGKLPLKFSASIDSLSITSHKIGGPKGIAGLYLKAGHKVRPLLLGGAQEQGMRSSTEAFPLIAGFHMAMKISMAEKIQAQGRTKELSEILKTKISGAIPLQFPFTETSPYILSFILEGVSSDIILRHLEMRGFYLSSTSACSSKITGFNPALHAMNIPEKFHKNFLRISLGPQTTSDEVNSLVKAFSEVWSSLKHVLTNGRGK